MKTNKYHVDTTGRASAEKDPTVTSPTNPPGKIDPIEKGAEVPQPAAEAQVTVAETKTDTRTDETDTKTDENKKKEDTKNRTSPAALSEKPNIE